MSETLSATMARPRRPTLEFDALYRDARADVYAYVASVVGYYYGAYGPRTRR